MFESRNQTKEVTRGLTITGMQQVSCGLPHAEINTAAFTTSLFCITEQIRRYGTDEVIEHRILKLPTICSVPILLAILSAATKVGYPHRMPSQSTWKPGLVL